jgi:Multiprotein bridging factor 1
MQDWETVSLGKPRSTATKAGKTAAIASAQRSGTLETEKRWAGGENKSAHAPHMNLKKLEESEELKREFMFFVCPISSRSC